MRLAPPQVVDVPPDDLRRGKFQLNPQAEAARRRRLPWRDVLLMSVLGYIAGGVAGWFFHITRTNNLLVSLVMAVATVLIALGALSAGCRILTRKPPSSELLNAVGMFAVAFSIKAFG